MNLASPGDEAGLYARGSMNATYRLLLMHGITQNRGCYCVVSYILAMGWVVSEGLDHGIFERSRPGNGRSVTAILARQLWVLQAQYLVSIWGRILKPMRTSPCLIPRI